MKPLRWVKAYLFLLTSTFFLTAHASDINGPLPSWNEGPVKQSIIQFVEEVTNKNSSYYVPPEDRIATFDNDGTMWLEQPMYTEVIFALDRLPEWKNQYNKLTIQAIHHAMAVTHSGMSVEDFKTIEKKWLATTKNPRYQRYYTELIYQPMLEVMEYLRQNQFKVYIVSGGGQDFIRTYSEEIYHVPIENVIGTTEKTKYVYQSKQPQLIKVPEILFIDDNEGKPVGINLFIGKKPIIAFGNSDGDRQMLEWTQSGQGKRLMLLVHHDDAKREYAYDTKSKVGTFSASLIKEAAKNHWQVISMKNDWKVIFPFER
ncbi:MAG: haloacid dehalogenase-like hydrolase [Gammaproteobacteria bacterium]|nr:MAG: haloacid dehalogenase-like hydrolase [Gammaproteobacteria bacterium]